jgi:hypothetical protein
MHRNNSDDSHLAIEGRVHVDFAKVESDLSGARHKVDPSLIDVEGVDVNFMDLNIIGEAAFPNLKIESLVVDKVRREDSSHQTDNVADGGYTDRGIDRAGVTDVLLSRHLREGECE